MKVVVGCGQGEMQGRSSAKIDRISPSPKVQLDMISLSVCHDKRVMVSGDIIMSRMESCISLASR